MLSPQEVNAFLSVPGPEPAVGEWPSAEQIPLSDEPKSNISTVVTDLSTGKPLPRVHIAIIPTDDWTTIPAYLRWGDWGRCPPPEFHVAALRSWRDRYGAELVGLGSNSMNLRIARQPATRAEALSLARELYAYCPDLFLPGIQTYSTIAAALMSRTWWNFWWG